MLWIFSAIAVGLAVGMVVVSRRAAQLGRAIAAKEAERAAAQATAEAFQQTAEEFRYETKSLRRTLEHERAAAQEMIERRRELIGKIAGLEQRAEQLSKALRESEDTREAAERQAAQLRQEVERWKHLSYAAEGRVARQIANIFAYNGTDEGQQEVT